jgi:peptide/nickel transport system ATP-binding protein
LIGLFLLAVSMNEHIDPRSTAGPERAMSGPVLAVTGLLRLLPHLGVRVEREVRAVDDVSLSIAADEIYGLAGESSSGKTTLIKTIAAPSSRRCR